jgi:hypothetical protein
MYDASGVNRLSTSAIYVKSGSPEQRLIGD